MEIQPISTAEETPNSKASSIASSQNSHANNHHQADPNSMQSWWVSISMARSRIESLASILFSNSFTSNSASISSLADSDRPSRALLDSPEAYDSVSSFLSRPISGSGDDPLCQWLYETYQSPDPDLRLVVISFLPILSGLYLSRVISGDDSLSGFEAVILSIYAAEAKARDGKPVTIATPDMSQPSLYHTPRQNVVNVGSRQHRQQQNVTTPTREQLVSFVSPPLEPQSAVKSTKRACIVGVALDCYHTKISLMPSRSKVDFCEFAAAWAGQDCSCRYDLDQDSVLNACSSTGSDGRAVLENGEMVVNNEEDMGKLSIVESSPPISHGSNVGNGGEQVSSSGSVSRQGTRIPLPWELLQPMLKILGHCLLGPLNSQDLRDAASVSIRSIYARASHDLMPQAILASRSLIQLDNSTRTSGKDASVVSISNSNPNTPNKPRKPEVFLVSK